MSTDLSSAFSHNLKDIVGEHGVAPPERLAAYSIDGRTPHAVVFPSTVEEVSGVLSFAWREGKVVVPWGGGTRIEVGNIIRNLDLILDTTRLSRVLEHQPADLTATVEAGVTIEDLQKALAQHGQFLPLDPPVPSKATIGGTLASSAAGPLRWQYGHVRDLVIGMRIVQADGTVTKSGGRVVKNVTGYDMARLHIGGFGTLGVIVEVSFKVTPISREERTVLGCFATPEACCSAALEVFQGDFTPLALTSINAQGVRRLEQPVVSSAWANSHLLAVRLAGRAPAVERQEHAALQLCMGSGAEHVESLSREHGGRFWRTVTDQGWGATDRPSLAVRANLLPSRVAEFWRGLEDLEREPGCTLAIQCHLGYGTVQAHWHGDSQAPAQLLTEVSQLATSLEGYLVVERCPLDVKGQIDVWGSAGEDLLIMRRMKEQYDPKGILNPGRFIGGI